MSILSAANSNVKTAKSAGIPIRRCTTLITINRWKWYGYAGRVT